MVEDENLIRDKKDRPILRAALDAGADLFLTGDKNFLESSVTDPRIISVSDFLMLQMFVEYFKCVSDTLKKQKESGNTSDSQKEGLS